MSGALGEQPLTIEIPKNNIISYDFIFFLNLNFILIFFKDIFCDFEI